MLKICQPSPLRVFTIGEDLISTRERKPRCGDPTDVSCVELDPHSGNLTPVEIDMTGRRDPIHPYDVQGPKRYGYPLCWSRTGFEWYPFMPAVCSFHYPIFQAMVKAQIVSTGSGWKLRDEDILHISNVEHVLLETIKATGGGQLSDLEHVTPHWPSKFGYDRLHRTDGAASKSKRATLNAFTRMLAYCCYSISHKGSNNDAHSYYFSNPTEAKRIIDRIGPRPGILNTHVLVKLVWGTLGEIFRASNFVGVIVSYHRPFHYPAVLAMSAYSVPIYVRWHKDLKLQSYNDFHQHHMLKEWLPSLEDFQILDAPPPAVEPAQTYEDLSPADPPPANLTPPVNNPTPANPTRFFADPMDYVCQRKAQIKEMADTNKITQQMKDRQNNAMKFGIRSVKSSAHVYCFEGKEYTDPATGTVSTVWERILLNRDQADRTYNCASPTQLWYVCLPSSAFIL